MSARGDMGVGTGVVPDRYMNLREGRSAVSSTDVRARVLRHGQRTARPQPAVTGALVAG
jgi:hypothetical protein